MEQPVTTIISHGPLIGPVIAALRANAGITQAELATRTGVAASQISKYETSVVTPDLDTTARLLTGLDHRLCAVPRVDAVAARQRQSVIDAAMRIAHPPAGTDWADHIPDLVDAVALMHSADPFTDSGSIYGENADLRTELAAAHRLIADMSAAITDACNTLAPIIRKAVR
jgi:transcriptional regulator with XRE-family HTH domain